MVSPILKGQEGLAELKVVLDTMQECGAKVDHSCGVHIHHGVNDLTFEMLKSTYALYVRYEEVIDELMPLSRRGNSNTYCGSLLRWDMVRTLGYLSQCKNYQDLVRMYHTRYIKLNHQNYLTRGTLEFRQHSGSLEYSKISAWIVFTQSIVERAVAGKVNCAVHSSNWTTLKEALRVDGSSEELVRESFRYLSNRRRKLAA